MKPYDDPMWWEHLDDLETRNPSELETMLKAGTLRKYLDDLVTTSNQLQASIKGRHPVLDEADLQMLSTPTFQQAKPNQQLSRKGQAMLAKFKAEIEREADPT